MAGKDLKGALSGMRGGMAPAPMAAEPRAFGDRFREELEQQSAAVPIQTIAISELFDNPFQYLARTATDESLQEEKIEELAESIRTNGFYGALLARARKEGGYELAYGHRRRFAAQRVGLDAVPVKVMPLDNEQMTRIMASENFSREDLTPIGEANVVGHLYTALNMTVKDISAAIGRSRGWVQNRLDLYEAPNDLKHMVGARPDSMSFVSTLSTVIDPVARETLAQQVISEQLTREQLKRRLPKTSAPPAASSLRTAKRDLFNKVGQLDPTIDKVEEAIKELEDQVKKRGKVLNLAEITRMQQLIRRMEKLRP